MLTKNDVVYISGPMTGYPECNFPAFYGMEDVLAELEVEVVNPARNGRGDDKTWGDYIKLDLANMCQKGITAVVVLPKWRESRGARLEVHVAQELDIPIYYHKGWKHSYGWAHDLKDFEVLDESVIAEADRIINGPRQEFYGHPLDNMRKTAGILNSMFEDKLKAPFTEEDVTLLMMGVKLARHVHRPQRDNLVDIIGYAGCHEKVERERQRREALEVHRG